MFVCTVTYLMPPAWMHTCLWEHAPRCRLCVILPCFLFLWRTQNKSGDKSIYWIFPWWSMKSTRKLNLLGSLHLYQIPKGQTLTHFPQNYSHLQTDPNIHYFRCFYTWPITPQFQCDVHLTLKTPDFFCSFLLIRVWLEVPTDWERRKQPGIKVS